MQYVRAHGLINEVLKQVDLTIRADLIFLKSTLYHRQNLFEEEIETILEYQREKPDDHLAEPNLGVAYLVFGDYYNAARHLTRAIELIDGYYPLASLNLYYTYIRRGDHRSAKKQRDKLVSMGIPDSWIEMLNIQKPLLKTISIPLRHLYYYHSAVEQMLNRRIWDMTQHACHVSFGGQAGLRIKAKRWMLACI